MNKKNISASDLCAFLLSQQVFNCGNEDIKLFSDRKEELEGFTRIDQIFNLLNAEYVSFLNYEILTLIIEKYSLNEDQEELQYPEHLKIYIKKHQISQFPNLNHALQQHTEASQIIALKFNIELTNKLARVKELSDAIADIMNWKAAAVRIYSIEEGCVVVSFLIPAFLAKTIFTSDDTFTVAKKEEFAKLDALWLKYNDHTFYFKVNWTQ